MPGAVMRLQEAGGLDRDGERPAPRLVRVRVEDRPGVLQRVTNCLGRRGLRLSSCSVAQGPESGILSLWLQVSTGSQPADQVVKQLAKLIDVVSVDDLTGADTLEWVTALVEIQAGEPDRVVEDGLRRCGAVVVRRGAGSLLAALSGPPAEVAAALGDLRHLPMVDWVLGRPIALAATTLPGTTTATSH